MRYYLPPIIAHIGLVLQTMLFRPDPLQSLRRLVGATLLVLMSACVYRLDVQQGNLLEEHDIDAVQVGMTRSQVRFLLGTPVVEDTFHQDRWDYIYYFRQGRKRVTDRSWLIVYFDGDRVREIRKDVTPEPS
ncbi:MAG: outer membrane protein assembly factor BamE [Gammaproteobacteria bacterium]|nr:MAG: outer membrane protein assembly factor BamE [Gammaproteobacteria bacterium]